MKYITTVGEREFLVEILDENKVIVDGKMFNIDFQPVSNQPVYSLIIDGSSHEAYVYEVDHAWQVIMGGQQYTIQVEDERERRIRNSTSGTLSSGLEYQLKAPMPGLVVLVAVEDGQAVKKGDLLLILESMKMQNELRAQRSGTISRLWVKSGDRVEQNQTICRIS